MLYSYPLCSNAITTSLRSNTRAICSSLWWRGRPFSIFRSSITLGNSLGRLIDRRQVNAARSAGLNVQVWTPNSPELLEEYCKWPVSALITDYPELVPCLAGGEK